MLLIASRTWPIEGLASADPVSQRILSCSVDLRKTRDINLPGIVGDVVASVTCYSVVLTNAPAVNDEKKHDAADFIVAAHDTDNLVG